MMKKMIFILMTMMITSCDAVKRVNRNTSKQVEVIKNYSLKHPSTNDTFTIYRPGDTVISVLDNYKTDTLYRYVSPNCPPEKTVTRMQKVIHTIRDTARVTIIDRSREKAYQHVANVSEAKTTAMSIRANEYKDRRDLWRRRFFILLAISVVSVFLTIKFF